MTSNNIVDSNVTYEALINSAANSLYNELMSSSVSSGTYKNNKVSFTIGSGVTCGAGTKYSQSKVVTLTETEKRNETYTAPTLNQILNDLATFMDGVGVPINNTTPTPDGAISFFFALNFFVEKAIIKRAVSVSDNANPTYHLHYKAPSPSSYSKIPYNYSETNTTTEQKINNIYNQLKSTSLLSDEVRGMSISSAAHSSSCSSSSCSSSSCSSSSFIVYFNLS
jgi:hypothetical protein